MDYEQARQPFELGKGDNYVITIHGFPDIPYDMLPLGQFLAEHGFHVIGPLLPGFGVSKEDLLAHSNWKEWQNHIDDTLEMITHQHPRHIFITGISMGGTSALYTAATHPLIEGIVIISAPVLVKGFLPKLVGLMSKVKTFVPFGTDFDVQDPETKKDPIFQELVRRYENKSVLPAIKEELAYFSAARQFLPKITQPLLICMGKKDYTVHPSNPELILKSVNSLNKQIRWYERSGHYITFDYDKDQLFTDIHAFFTSLL